ncbi:MAG: tRNA uridine-5-carboxymethylaminomethyl(34) synthesis GTPase MnmE [Lentisphaeria bacterium]|nr:tRNA uridine-5-carboxymethylaminomethyl(34) synthesis GTPase MnmE [Lentisphaeria bacterium]
MSFDNVNDTIAAICTAPGGALAILRLSGPDALSILNTICRTKHKISREHARKAILAHALRDDGETCLAIYMPGPASYTGEDVAEIQCHGGDFAPLRLLRAALDAGARHAEGGEFTRRAFLNGKLDLTQAEAVADMIHAGSNAAMELAERQMSGQLGRKLRLCRENILRVVSEIESRLDFTDEDLDWIPADTLCNILNDTKENLLHYLDTANTGALIRNGIRLVIAGAPNAGKSSLLNALLGYDRAIVTPIPGATRDTLEETLSIRGIALRATDTAGLRSTSDQVEQLGVERTRKAVKSADVVLWLLDSTEPEKAIAHFLAEKEDGFSGKVILCWNKSDLTANQTLPEIPGYPQVLSISAVTGEALDKLTSEIENAVWRSAGNHEDETAISERHAAMIRQALPALDEAMGLIQNEMWELAAPGLHQAIHTLGTITGESADPDILDEIFSRFCIGK